MPQTNYHNNVHIDGDLTVTGTLSVDPGIDREQLTEDSLAVYVVPLTELRVHDAPATNLPAAAANDDMGLINGTFGTDLPTLQGIDFKAGSTDEKSRFQWALPPEYVAGGTVTLRISAGMITTISDGTCTLDVEVFESGRVGAVSGSDLYAGAEGGQSINSVTLADKDYTLTPTTLVAGDLLDVRLSFVGTDTATGTAVIPEIAQIEFLVDVKG